MKLFVCVQLIFVVFLISLCWADSGQKGPKRSRLVNTNSLIPFPRIGRGGDLAWEVEPAYTKAGGRAWINELASPKRNGPKTVSTGLWFGPRLGRLQKRGSYSDDPWTYILLGGPEEETKSRQVLMPFMRIGRSGARRIYFRPSEAEEKNRLSGKVIHPMIRTGRGGELPWQSDESDGPNYRQPKYTPRLGRESEELEDYNDENPMQNAERGAA